MIVACLNLGKFTTLIDTQVLSDESLTELHSDAVWDLTPRSRFDLLPFS